MGKQGKLGGWQLNAEDDNGKNFRKCFMMMVGTKDPPKIVNLS